MSSITRKLFCLIEGENIPFRVTVTSDDCVASLRVAVLEQCKNDLHGIDAVRLVLWKINNVLLQPWETLHERIRAKGDLQEFAERLVTEQDVLDIFPEQPSKDSLHIVIQKLFVITKPQFPIQLETMSVRKRTVAALYEKLKSYRFIQVRGTPASGKSTLAQLLRNHIMALEPFTPLIWVDGWSRAVVDTGTWREHLENTKHWNDIRASVFIFDEAQLTYADHGLWNSLFKVISDYPQVLSHRIIIFTSYGSPTQINELGTDMLIRSSQMVTLAPIDHHDGLEAAGLYLTQTEFNEICDLRKYSEYFDPAFLDFIFKISSGHAGAIVDVIDVIFCDDSYRKIRASQKLFTMSDFQHHFTHHHLYTGLQDASNFRRGLPDDDSLQDLEVASVFRNAVRDKIIMVPGLTSKESAASKLCFSQGWLHADKVVVNNWDNVGYFFASPLHHLLVEWKLCLQNPVPIKAPNLLEFVIQVIKRFSPLNLEFKRSIGPNYLQNVPEALHHDEFYRCCYDLTLGSLNTLSEFGRADGQADFYIPSKKWGIELLRDGQLLEQHNNCFSPTGQYGKNLEIDEYIALDFTRMKNVVRSHPHLTDLFHVIFSDDWGKVTIVDNKCCNVEEFGLLRTQS